MFGNVPESEKYHERVETGNKHKTEDGDTTIQNVNEAENNHEQSQNVAIMSKSDSGSLDECSDAENESINPTSTKLLTGNGESVYEDETRCGFGNFHPDWLQKLASKKSYVLLYGLIGMFDIALGTYFVSTISTVEKRFKLPSRATGMISAAWDFGGLFSNLTLSYLGSKGHKTRWVAAGILLAGLSCYLRLVPHLVLGPGQDALELTTEYQDMYHITHNTTGNQTNEYSGKQMCKSEMPEEDCSVGSISVLPVTMFVVSAFLLGIGTSMYYTLGITYMDDNVRKNKTPLLLAIWHCLRMLGPTLGFLFGSYALTLYVDTSLHPTIASDDPRWIGAWWLGFLPIGTVLICLSGALALFLKSYRELLRGLQLQIMEMNRRIQQGRLVILNQS
ncbi:hypothetical protein L9F63_016347 [Diploptera punctata]|uniref:Uncharacterized protein n=1 Tax=Diploptera punctata TaxID=6984 RepID=A0AAD8EHL1_DIPPU|nr:hypothetical protein L9F63_016347 [Diploptera punctata]